MCILGMSSKALKKAALISALITVALLGVVVWYTDWDLLWSSLVAASPGWLCASVVLMIVLQFAAGLRLAYLLPTDTHQPKAIFGKSVEISFLYQALIKILPFRLGEAAFFWLVQQKIQTPFERNLGIFLHFRLWDFRIVATSFLVCGGWLVTTRYDKLTPYVIAAALLGSLFFMLSPAFLIGLAEKSFRLSSQIPGCAFLQKGETLLASAKASLAEESTQRSAFVLFLMTLLIWSCYFSVFYCLMLAIGMDVSPFLTVAVVSGMTLTSIIPIQTVGGLGLIEIGQSSLYVLAGLSISEAASRSLTVSALFLLLCLVVPATLWVLLRVKESVAENRQGQAEMPLISAPDTPSAESE